VVTGNSGSGLEALIHGCHVITCGMADYGHMTTRCDTTDALSAALDAPRPDSEKLESYLNWRIGEQSLDLSAPNFGPQLLRKLEQAGFL
jgi:hypothetical protein